MKKHSLFLTAAIAALILASCNQQGQGDFTRRAVDPAFSWSVPFQDYKADATAGDTIRLDDGTSIYIPAGIFVDASGAPVNGPVELHYRAFYSPGEIIASGITMVYDTAGTENVFTSAGMFEINGTQNGKPISIAPGKFITMDFASSRNDASFSFYKLDTASANWQFLAATTADSSALVKNLLSALAKFPQKPAPPIEYDGKKPVIDIDVNTTNHPELAGYTNILWQYAGSGSNPEQNQWIYSTEWTSAQLQVADSNTCMYDITLKNTTRSFSTQVVPVLRGSDYKKAVAEFNSKMESFEASEKVRKENLQQLAQANPFVRPLTIGSFGTFNCDMFDIFGESDLVKAEFHFDDPEFESNRENVMLYFVTGGTRFISAYNAASVPTLRYLKNMKSCMVAVIRGSNKAAILDNNSFRNGISENGLASKFTLHPTTQAINNSDDIDKLILDL